ncbi:hypothetical protein Pmar_PMAR004831 [Perkinsus marinus ATCC 50983]|uniref:Uncharacterized protein n=1 Tax=Perkinsus marinus (strain ATCC 50983 / TXsc) TaxID=423536 RepID=C5LLA9_PERM5|nr:hypothetical protein Pmar_PMAR004831 [Perkinsus marinus ATCC 50983]EER02468.1 hypothetical protein Pmar_PMAR004831 [Perkinsus marinus ATCC 50983]|eukprot:XP_002769750.1 hypothetical protein Pmar_PMAR004831 [Perkinsus marinus ATCC 50983]
MRIRFNREAAGNFSLGFCDSITSENLTVDRSRSRVCGKGIAMEPISGIVYHTGTPVMGSMARPVPIEDPGGECLVQQYHGKGAYLYKAPPLRVLVQGKIAQGEYGILASVAMP